MISIREANKNDFNFILDLMIKNLKPYYGGDHEKHATRIFNTHISGGLDQIGFFSTFQKMFIVEYNGKTSGMLHLVGKKQGTIKISPLIVCDDSRGKGIGKFLIDFIDDYAKKNEYRQVYCTVARQNKQAYNFFKRNGFTVAGTSDSHYKDKITETMLYKEVQGSSVLNDFDKKHISVVPMQKRHQEEVKDLLIDKLPKTFGGIDNDWVDSLFKGYERRNSNDINTKYKLIYVAENRGKVSGVVGATPKKGSPIKLMPFIAVDFPSYIALLKDIPFFLKSYGHKLYIHISPNADETKALLETNWKLDSAMPEAYLEGIVTQQWSYTIKQKSDFRSLRVKEQFLKEIQNGNKDLEVRVAYDSFNNIKIGSIVNFNNRFREVRCEIVDIRRYENFRNMLLKENPERIVPGCSKDELLNILEDIYPSSKETLGVLVFQLRKL
ncbi:MAG: GNAT family N-acetyltransferase [Crocinitomicaceae bacterium]|nr:GNAT family N-acetyltransferase [Crocinitomicaceae bacterium]